MPIRQQAIILTNAGILSIGSLGTNFNKILIEIVTFLLIKMHLKMLSVKWQPFCLGLNVLSKLVNLTLVVLNFIEENEKYIFAFLLLLDIDMTQVV